MLLDANVLVLLIVGRFNPGLIARHRRLQGYTYSDFEVLEQLLRRKRQSFVTPQTLAEASNLLRTRSEPERGRLMEQLRSLIEDSEEIVILSKDAVQERQYKRLGLADAALLAAASPERPLLTSDLDLYLAAASDNPDAAIHFEAHRQRQR